MDIRWITGRKTKADVSGIARWEMEGDGTKNILEY